MPDVPSKTVVWTGHCNQEDMEEAEVQWPVKGKEKGDVKIWHCVLLPQAGKTGKEDIGLKQFRRPMDQQKNIGPKPAKKYHTTAGKATASSVVLSHAKN